MENKIESKNFGKPGIKKYLKIGVLVIVLGIIGFWGVPKYQDWKFNREMKEMAEEINKPYLEDAYGGKTPKETLEMFIAAVEKEDFDLASKYFVLSKQEEWGKELVEINNAGKMSIFLKPIKEEVISLNEKDEKKWAEQENYISKGPILFDFVKYPSGIWKIKEI